MSSSSLPSTAASTAASSSSVPSLRTIHTTIASQTVLPEYVRTNKERKKYRIKKYFDIPYNCDPDTYHYKHNLDIYIPIDDDANGHATVVSSSSSSSSSSLSSTNNLSAVSSLSSSLSSRTVSSTSASLTSSIDTITLTSPLVAHEHTSAFTDNGGTSKGSGTMPVDSSSFPAPIGTITSSFSTASKAWPVIVFVHGGGWKKGGRRTFGGMHGNVGEAFAQEGYIVVVISYRLSSVRITHMVQLYSISSLIIGTLVFLGLTKGANKESIQSLGNGGIAACYCIPFVLGLASQLVWWRSGGRKIKHPDHVNDSASAIHWVLRNIHTYGGDNENIILMGHSSGAHMVSMLMLESERIQTASIHVSQTMEKYPSLSKKYQKDENIPLSLGNIQERIKGIVCLSGVYSAELLKGVKSMAIARTTVRYDDPFPWFLTPVVNYFRYFMYLYPVFGTDSSKWDTSLAVGYIQNQLKEMETETKDGNRNSSNSRDRTSVRNPTPTTTTRSRNDRWIRVPLYILNAEPKKDWTLNSHTDALLPYLEAYGYTDITRRTIMDTDHIRYIMGMNRPGTIGQEIVVTEISNWIKDKLAINNWKDKKENKQNSA